MALPTRKFDAVIVGAGGAGMRAALQLSEAGFKVMARAPRRARALGVAASRYMMGSRKHQ